MIHDAEGGPGQRAHATTRSARRNVRYGFDRLGPEQHRPRHAHDAAYATLVLAGAFHQTGYGGRYRVEAGDIVVQPTLDRHADHMMSRGVDLVRLPWRFDAGAGGVWRGCNVEEIYRASQSDLKATLGILCGELTADRASSPILEHWADRFFTDLRMTPTLRVQTWADAHGLTRECVSRNLRRVYGVSPAELRSELRTRTAWRLCIETGEPLAAVAIETGFSDQAHMTRAMRHLTGATPAAWRRSHFGPMAATEA
ncbi:AraC family transcriptional regulator [Phenylobacterium sp.]|uniref:helix-turn-helix domain-containing protein n=1 Tax=Phenylobacterium sp. TaxID=1871053 RepID=UPI00121C5B33|nr:MAG: AraC family transcriptional regulator [Phenylobacterium sp.]